MVNKWCYRVCLFEDYNYSFAYEPSALNNSHAFIWHISHSLHSLCRGLYLVFSFMYSDLLKEFIAFGWLWNQWTLHLHCITLGVESQWHFWLQLYYNCSPRNQIMQKRSILLWAEVTSKCKISQALRDKQDHREWEREWGGWWYVDAG